MKHFLILPICYLCLILNLAWASVCFAQENQNEGENIAPFIYVSGQNNRTEKTEKFEPLPFTFTQDIAIKTPFGRNTTAAFVPHTTDFNIIIKILGNGDIVWEEYIHLMNTSDKNIFSRTLPRLKNTDLILTMAEKDGQSVKMDISAQNNNWVIKDYTPMTNGVHQFKITYLLKNALLKENDIARLKLSLTGFDWPLPVERFSVLVLLPQKTTLFRQDMLFGKNELMIPEAVTIQLDSQSNILYTLTRPLPSLADVGIAIDFDASAITPVSWSDWLLEQMNHTLFLLCAIILILYTVITIIYLTHQKSKRPLKEISGYNLIALHFVRTGQTNALFLKKLSDFYVYQKKKHPFLKTILKIKQKNNKLGNFLLRIYSYLNIVRKYILTMSIIIGLSIFQTHQVGMPLSLTSIAALIVFSIILIAIIYTRGEVPHLQKGMQSLEHILNNKDIGFGLSPASLNALFLQLYPYALVLNHQKEWINSLKSYNINTTPFTFLEQKGDVHEI